LDDVVTARDLEARARHAQQQHLVVPCHLEVAEPLADGLGVELESEIFTRRWLERK